MTQQTAGAEQQTATSTRTITTVSTRGEKVKIAFTGNTWAELKRLLTSGGEDIEGRRFSPFNLNNMKCVESLNRTTLEHPNAIVPNQDFNLFLMPLKNKSGGPARDKVKALFAQNKDAARAHFGNYTNKNEETLAQLLKSYPHADSVSDTPVIPAAIASTVAAKTSSATVSNVVQSLSEAKVGAVINSLLHAKMMVEDSLAALGWKPEQKEEAPVKSEEEIQREKQQREKEEQEKREQEERRKKEEEERRKKKEEEEALDRDMRELASGFGDVRL